jgi:polyisoprenoid-binding protein YceI
MITLVSGKYREYSGNIETEDDDFSTAKISFHAIVNSIDTHDEKRDAYLKGPDFLDTGKYPYLYFNSNHVQKAGDGFSLSGDLTIKDITVKTEFEVDYSGIQTDSNGVTTAGFTVKGIINRKLWGLIWNEAQESGGMMAREVVQVICQIQLIRVSPQSRKSAVGAENPDSMANTN